jgi:hypothetical protein
MEKLLAGRLRDYTVKKGGIKDDLAKALGGKSIKF